MVDVKGRWALITVDLMRRMHRRVRFRALPSALSWMTENPEDTWQPDTLRA